jgi:hypothetical protein
MGEKWFEEEFASRLPRMFPIMFHTGSLELALAYRFMYPNDKLPRICLVDSIRHGNRRRRNYRSRLVHPCNSNTQVMFFRRKR